MIAAKSPKENAELMDREEQEVLSSNSCIS
jgi:hypothetical protein